MPKFILGYSNIEQDNKASHIHLALMGNATILYCFAYAHMPLCWMYHDVAQMLLQPLWVIVLKVTAHSNNRNSKSSREVILGSVRL